MKKLLILAVFSIGLVGCQKDSKLSSCGIINKYFSAANCMGAYVEEKKCDYYYVQLTEEDKFKIDNCANILKNNYRITYDNQPGYSQELDSCRDLIPQIFENYGAENEWYCIDSDCGNEFCDWDENRESCYSDCGDCGNDVCDAGENTENCPEDCPSQCICIEDELPKCVSSTELADACTSDCMDYEVITDCDAACVNWDFSGGYCSDGSCVCN